MGIFEGNNDNEGGGSGGNASPSAKSKSKFWYLVGAAVAAGLVVVFAKSCGAA